jgi:hypothetical protein
VAEAVLPVEQLTAVQQQVLVLLVHMLVVVVVQLQLLKQAQPLLQAQVAHH